MGEMDWFLMFGGKRSAPDADDLARARLDEIRRDRLERREQKKRAEQAGATERGTNAINRDGQSHG